MLKYLTSISMFLFQQIKNHEQINQSNHLSDFSSTVEFGSNKDLKSKLIFHKSKINKEILQRNKLLNKQNKKGNQSFLKLLMIKTQNHPTDLRFSQKYSKISAQKDFKFKLTSLTYALPVGHWVRDNGT